MTFLALLRHGETEWSREGRIQGRTDIRLSEAGRTNLESRVLPEECRGMRVLTSPLRRCMETAAALGIAHASGEERLVEMHWGAWEGRTLEELRSQLGPAMRENEARGLDFSPPGGESPRRVFDRVRPLLAEVAAVGRDTLGISHKGVIRTIFAAAVHWDMTGRPPLKLDWASVHLFRLDNAGLPVVARLNLPLGRRAGRLDPP